MLSLGTITVAGLVVAAVLLWIFFRTRAKDQLAAIMEKRKAGSKLVTRAEYVESLDRMPVALALAGDTFYYENPDLEASFELSRIDEIEYDDELATGRPVGAGQKALRLRTHGTTFEFVLPAADAARWTAALPPRRLGGGQRAAV